MTVSVSGSLSVVTNPGEGGATVHFGLDVVVGGILDLSLDVNLFAGGPPIVVHSITPLMPSSSVGGGLLDTALPAVVAPVHGLTASVGGSAGVAAEPAVGSTIIDLAGTTIDLPDVFKA